MIWILIFIISLMVRRNDDFVLVSRQILDPPCEWGIGYTFSIASTASLIALQ